MEAQFFGTIDVTGNPFRTVHGHYVGESVNSQIARGCVSRAFLVVNVVSFTLLRVLWEIICNVRL
jgi:hypothetical protein